MNTRTIQEMARKLNNMGMFMVVLMAIGALQMQSIKAQNTTHIVGDSLGWNVPSGQAAYPTWASTQTFTVGDVLVFNFVTNIHDVAEVTQAAFDGCNSTNPISLSNTGPTNITLSSAGSHYYICTFPSHCNLGQKLAINVSAASSTPPAATPQPAAPTPPPVAAPQPSATTPSPVSAPTPATSPSPATSPAPTPARAPVTYVVGDRLGWNILQGGAAAYRTWASGKSFVIGDILEFNFINRTHDVAELTRTAFDSCNTNTTLSLTTTSPARITLNAPGEHFFTCTFAGHCDAGQKLAINVTTATATSPTASTPTSGTPAPSSSTTPPPPSSPAGETSPPPPSGSGSAPAFAVTALPITILSVALAFFY